MAKTSNKRVKTTVECTRIRTYLK